jgi:thioredoxin-like negative regulator of GroEL
LILFYSDDIPTVNGIMNVFEEFDEQLKGKVIVMKCDIDSQIRTKEYFQMKTLPAVLFLKGGKVYGNLAGPASKSKYQNIVKEGLVEMIKDEHLKKEKNNNILDVDEMYGC